MRCALTRQAMRLLFTSILALLTLPLYVGQGQEEEWPGVEGTTYRSPSYGYTLSWDESWQVSEAYVGPPDDGLTLSNGTSTVMVIGTQAFGGDHGACLQGTADLLRDAWGDIRPVNSTSGAPLAGEDDALAWGVFAATLANPAGGLDRYTVFAECRSIAPQATTVAVMHWAPAETYETQFKALEAILRSLQEVVWPGVEGTTYRSPSFDYTLSWDESWAVSDAYAGPPDDGLTLSNGTSMVMVVGTQAFAGDRRNCLQATVELLNNNWDDVGLASDSSGAPLVGEDDVRAWGVFAATFADPAGGLDRHTVYAECQSVAPEGTTVTVIHSAPEESYEAETRAVEELLRTLQDDESSRVDDGDGTTAEAARMLATAGPMATLGVVIPSVLKTVAEPGTPMLVHIQQFSGH